MAEPLHVPNWVKVVVGFVAIMIFVNVCSAIGKNNKTPETAESRSVSKSVINEDKPIIEVSPEELWKAYDENEIAADERFKHSRIEVAGKVKSLGKGIMDDPYIVIAAGGGHSIQLALSDTAIEKATTLFKGSFARAICQSVTKTMGSPYLRKCALY